VIESVQRPVTKGEVARLSGLSAKMLRHYGSIGLWQNPRRASARVKRIALNRAAKLVQRIEAMWPPEHKSRPRARLDPAS
jgi:hypothetical protein